MGPKTFPTRYLAAKNIKNVFYSINKLTIKSIYLRHEYLYYLLSVAVMKYIFICTFIISHLIKKNNIILGIFISVNIPV